LRWGMSILSGCGVCIESMVCLPNEKRELGF